MLSSNGDERCPAFRLDVGRIDDGEPTEREPLADEIVEQLERVGSGGLVVLVVGDHPATGIGRDDLRRQKVATRERALTGAAGADEDDERQLGMARFTATVSRVELESRGREERPRSMEPPATPTLGAHSQALRAAADTRGRADRDRPCRGVPSPARELAFDQLRHVWQPKRLVEPDEIRLHLASPH